MKKIEIYKVIECKSNLLKDYRFLRDNLAKNILEYYKNIDSLKNPTIDICFPKELNLTDIKTPSSICDDMIEVIKDWCNYNIEELQEEIEELKKGNIKQ